MKVNDYVQLDSSIGRVTEFDGVCVSVNWVYLPKDDPEPPVYWEAEFCHEEYEKLIVLTPKQAADQMEDWWNRGAGGYTDPEEIERLHDQFPKYDPQARWDILAEEKHGR